jgi:hypothetical protein
MIRLLEKIVILSKKYKYEILKYANDGFRQGFLLLFILFFISFCSALILSFSIRERLLIDGIKYHGLTNLYSIIVFYLLISIALSLLKFGKWIPFIVFQILWIPLLILGYLISKGIDSTSICTLFLIFFLTGWNYCINTIKLSSKKSYYDALKVTFLFLGILLFLGLQNMKKNYWLDEFCVGASLTEGMNYLDYSKFESLQKEVPLPKPKKSLLRTASDVLVYDSHPPLSEIIYLLFARAFGLHLGVLRILTLSIASIMTTLFWYIMKIQSNEKAAFIGTALLLSAPFIVLHYGIEVRPYILFAFFVLILLFFFRNYLLNGTSKDYMLWVIVSALLMYIHYFSIFLLAAIAFYSLLNIQTLRRKGIILGHLSILLLISPLLQGIIFQKHAKAEWLMLPELHMSKIGLPELTNFITSSFPIKDNSVIFFLLILISSFSIINVAIGFLNKKFLYTNTINLDIFEMKSTELKIFNSILIILPILIFIEFHSNLKNYYNLIYFDKAKTVSFADVLNIYLWGQICSYSIIVAIFIKLNKSLQFKSEQPIMYSALFYYSFLFLFSTIIMIIFVNATERIYTFRNAMFLNIPLFAMIGLILEYLLNFFTIIFKRFNNGSVK